MTDKELKDWCKTCDVEPPAMKFKCPECEHNTDKEQIIIDGVDVSECRHHYREFMTNQVNCSLDDFYHYDDKHCCEGDDCYFKQSARKTQIIDEIEEVIKPYQAQIELDALSLPTAIKSILERKTQECEQIKEKILKLGLNENHYKNEIKKLKKRILKDREIFKHKYPDLKLAREQFLQALEHFNWQIDLLAKGNDEMPQGSGGD